jgi:hypothetical protein
VGAPPPGMPLFGAPRPRRPGAPANPAREQERKGTRRRDVLYGTAGALPVRGEQRECVRGCD